MTDLIKLIKNANVYEINNILDTIKRFFRMDYIVNRLGVNEVLESIPNDVILDYLKGSRELNAYMNDPHADEVFDLKDMKWKKKDINVK